MIPRALRSSLNCAMLGISCRRVLDRLASRAALDLLVGGARYVKRSMPMRVAADVAVATGRHKEVLRRS